MALQNLVGDGIWLPTLEAGFSGTGSLAGGDTALIDADQEEVQFIGQVTIDGGGSKTFGTSGSKIGWLPGPSITLAANSTCTVGVKTAVDTSNGPPARATIGKAAFSVYKDLVGGTDTITSTTWREDAMASGTPFTVADGDLIAICFLLTTTSGSPSIKVRTLTPSTQFGFPACTLVTSGPTYTLLGALANAIIIFDDGAIGWFAGTIPCSAVDTTSATIGNTNIFGNIFRVPFTCKVDALSVTVTPTAGADFAMELYSTPLGTPATVESISVDQNLTTATAIKQFMRRLITPRTLTINTDYLVGVRQTTGTALTISQRDQSNASYFKPLGMGAECYAATSTAGATFAAINSGKRRYMAHVRICALDDGAGTAGGLLVNRGMRGGMV
jgi:hypothetical protein